MAAAISSASPPRFIGTLWRTRSIRSGSPPLAWMSVWITPRANRVDPDALAGQFLRHAQGHGVDGALGGGIVDVFVGSADTGCHRGQVDDGATGAAVPGRQAADGLLRTQEAAHHVGPQDALEAGCVHRLQAHLPLQHAGVVHQHVQPAERLVQALEHLLDLFFDTHVGLYSQRFAAPRAYDIDQRFGVFAPLPVVDAHGVAALRGETCRGCTDATTGSCDEHDPAHDLPP